MTGAPFRADLAEGPEGVRAFWRQASDGLRLRTAFWPAPGAAKGTILLFPGRTEHVEKYGRVARDLTGAGYNVATIDWRGQGLSDRLTEDPLLGHVHEFADYQNDVAQLVGTAREQDLPEPWHLVAHSMGGCIGLRALIGGLPVRRAVFSAPMWGIRVSNVMAPLAHVVPPVARLLGMETHYAPGTKAENYAAGTDFETNLLTTDPEQYAYIVRHALAEPGFALGGPSIHWVGRAMAEMRALSRLPRPALPVLTFLGSEEEIVSPAAIRAMHTGWASAELRLIEGARHELMMEAPGLRTAFFEAALAFLGEV